METEIGTSYGGFPLYKVRQRRYRCKDCGNEVIISTNHHSDCWPQCTGKCRQYIRTGRGANEREVVLPKTTTHEYLGEIE